MCPGTWVYLSACIIVMAGAAKQMQALNERLLLWNEVKKVFHEVHYMHCHWCRAAVHTHVNLASCNWLKCQIFEGPKSPSNTLFEWAVKEHCRWPFLFQVCVCNPFCVTIIVSWCACSAWSSFIPFISSFQIRQVIMKIRIIGQPAWFRQVKEHAMCNEHLA